MRFSITATLPGAIGVGCSTAVDRTGLTCGTTMLEVEGVTIGTLVTRCGSRRLVLEFFRWLLLSPMSPQTMLTIGLRMVFGCNGAPRNGPCRSTGFELLHPIYE